MRGLFSFPDSTFRFSTSQGMRRTPCDVIAASGLRACRWRSHCLVQKGEELFAGNGRRPPDRLRRGCISLYASSRKGRRIRTAREESRGRGLSKAVFGSGGNGGDSARAGVLKEGGADRERGKPLGERFPRSRVPPYCSSNEARFLLMTETRSGMICAISSMLPEQAASSRHRAGSSSTRRS